MAIFAPWLSPQDPFAQNLADWLKPPSAAHWLGTDALGRDILSRLIHGSRITLFIVGTVALIAPVIGLFVGTVAGFAGGWVDQVLMADRHLPGLPKLILALAFVALGPGIGNAVLALAITLMAALCAPCAGRDADHPQCRLYRRRPAAGRGTVRLLIGHVWPLCISSMIVRVALDMAGSSSRRRDWAFWGFGAQPPMPEWGR